MTSDDIHLYTESVLEDLKEQENQARQDKLESQKRKDLELSRRHELKLKRISLVRDVLSWGSAALLVLTIVSGIVFGFIHIGKKYESQHRIADAAWNSSCLGAGGTLSLNNYSTHDDNICTFANGFNDKQYYPSEMKFKSWADLCVGAGGKALPQDGNVYDYCVFPNGFSARRS